MSDIVFVQAYIKDKDDEGLNTAEIAKCLNVSAGMISSYRGSNYNPSITTAKFVYANEGIALHPFNKDSLEYEIRKVTK